MVKLLCYLFFVFFTVASEFLGGAANMSRYMEANILHLITILQYGNMLKLPGYKLIQHFLV